MKQAWCIAASKENARAGELVRWYSKRWGIEPQFRDTKDIHFGMGLSETSISTPERRDRGRVMEAMRKRIARRVLLLISALAVAILTLLGAAGEALGLDKYVKVNTVKLRTLSLFRQGCHYYNKLANMKLDEAKNLIGCFTDLLLEQKTLNDILRIL
jgi:hypothetical protein